MSSQRIAKLLSFIEMDPTDSFSKFALALEYLKMEKKLEALSLFLEITSSDENYVGVYYHLGNLYELMGDSTKALEIYTKGIDIAVKQHDNHSASELRQALEDLEYSLEN